MTSPPPKVLEDSLVDDTQKNALSNIPSSAQPDRLSITPKTPLAPAFLPPTPVQTNGPSKKKGRPTRFVKTRPPRLPAQQSRGSIHPPPPTKNSRDDPPQPFADATIPARGFGQTEKLEIGFEFNNYLDYSDESGNGIEISQGANYEEWVCDGDKDNSMNTSWDFTFGHEPLLDGIYTNTLSYEELETVQIGTEARPPFFTDFHGDQDQRGTQESAPGVMEFGIARSREDDFGSAWFGDGRSTARVIRERERQVPDGLVQLAQTRIRVEEEEKSVGATKYQVDAVYHASMRQALSGIRTMPELPVTTEGSKLEKEAKSITESLNEVQKVDESTEKWMENSKTATKRRRIRTARSGEMGWTR